MARKSSKKSDAHKQKLRDAARRRFANPAERTKHAKRMAEAYQDNPALHRMHVPSSNDKRSRTLTDLWQTPEYRDQILASRTTPEVKHKLRDAATEQWARDRESLLAAMRASRHAHVDPVFHDVEWLRTTNDTLTVTEMAEVVGCSQSCMSRQFAKFGLVPKQHPLTYTSGETQIMSFLTTLGVTDIRQRDRSLIPPYELDIYLPTYHVGIEYHGCFWHSYNRVETTAERRRHYDKHQRATDAGIRLLQFWDVEWTQHPTICHNIIQSALGRNATTGARAYEVRVPTHAEVAAFLTANHLQGPCPYAVAHGLYNNTGLVMVMSLGKSRFKPGSWEILRIATKSGSHIAGGVSKLWASLRPLIPAGSVVYSYADKRLFRGTVYRTLGFTWSHDTPPGYQYWRDGVLHSRLACQKHKLATLPGYVDTLTEAENMFQWGYRRLWDAGQAVWCYHT